MRSRQRSTLLVDTCIVALVGSAPVLLERLGGLQHAAADLVQMFIPNFAWWWSRPRWLGGWNPWVFGGFPANADPLVGHVHPLGLLWAFTSPLTAAAIEGVAAPTLAGIGMLLYLRRIGCGRSGSLIGALSFAGAGFVHAHAVHPEKLRTVLAVPWALLAIESLDGLGLIAGLGAAVAILVAGGHPQTIAYALAIVGAYALWLGRPRGRRGLALALGGALGAVVPMVTWLPAIQLILRASHATTMLTGLDRLPVACASTLVVPFACGGGAGPLYGRSLEAFPGCGLVDCTGYPGMIAWLAVLAGWRRIVGSARGRFWLGVAAAGLVLASGVAEAILPVPGVRAPSRALLWWNLGMAGAAALALRPPVGDGDALASRRAWLGAAVLLLAVVAGAATTGVVARRASLGSLLVLVTSATAALAIARRGSRWTRVLLVSVLAADLVGFGAAMNAGLPPRALSRLEGELETIGEVLDANGGAAALGRALVVPLMVGANWASIEEVPFLQGWNVLVPRAFSRLLGTDAPNRYEFAFITDPALLSPENAVLDLLRARLVVVPERAARDSRWTDAFADERWTLVGETERWHFYQNRRVRPVAWLVRRIRPASDAEAVEIVGGRRGAFDPTTEAVAAAAIEGLDPAPATGDLVEVEAYDDDEVRLRVRAAARALLVTSELAYPGWEASIAEEHVPILEVNGGFRALVVPAGVHAVTLRYRPLLGRIGLGIGAFSGAVLAACAAVAWW